MIIRETDSYVMHKNDDGTFSTLLKGGISCGTAGATSEMEALEQLMVYQRDLVNQRNDELNRRRAALPQYWLSDMWKPGIGEANDHSVAKVENQAE